MQKKQTASTNHPPAQRAGSKAADIAPSALVERLLNAEEVARILHVSRSTIYVLIQRGDLPAVHIGSLLRFLRRDIQHYIQEHADPK
jgi:excisionase family DNA binding protein